MKQTINIFWFRRDLRINDNIGLYHALQNKAKTLPIFIFDSEILDQFNKDDPRINFIYESLLSIKMKLQEKYKSDILLYHGKPIDIFKEITANYNVSTVYTNRDYEPYAIKRDNTIEAYLLTKNIAFTSFKDHVIFEKNEITKEDGNPYKVYTPYMKKWKTTFKTNLIKYYETKPYLDQLVKIKQDNFQLEDFGYIKSPQKIKSLKNISNIIQNYDASRNFLYEDSTTRVGPHIRFGLISIRELVQKSITANNETFCKELIWRDFFIQILWHFPETITKSFKPLYDNIKWRNNKLEFNAWCEGNTGYPLVDAGMRQLNKTGFMNNRVRMVTASFLCKHLLIDWRWGEAYFAARLHDYEMASNIGNWQWVAGSGADAAPYFRIFNPITQLNKFDKNLDYVKKWVKNHDDSNYPSQIVDHKFARERCLKTYKEAINSSN